MKKLFSILILSGFTTSGFSADIKQIDSNYKTNICNAIYILEGGAKTKFPYGIKSIPIKGNTQLERESYARAICMNTISKNYTRWQISGKTNLFEEFLCNRYCPVVSDRTGNKHWIKNINFYLKTNKTIE